MLPNLNVNIVSLSGKNNAMFLGIKWEEMQASTMATKNSQSKNKATTAITVTTTTTTTTTITTTTTTMTTTTTTTTTSHLLMTQF